MHWTVRTYILPNSSFRYKRKTASIFSQGQIKQALQLDYSTVKWTVWKAVVATAYCGGLRGFELRSITKGDVRIDEQGVWMQYQQAKQKGEEKVNQFLVPFGGPISFGKFVVSYLELRRKYEPGLGDDLPLFVRVCKDKLGRQPMGQNHLGHIGKSVAKELGLINPHTYTGHAFRRSAATEVASKGATSVMMKGHFGWVQESTALKYIDVTKERPTKVAELLTGAKMPVEPPAVVVAPPPPEVADVQPTVQALPAATVDTPMDALSAKFEAALNLTSMGKASLKGPSPLAFALGALGTTGIAATVLLVAPTGEKISIKVEGASFQISHH